LKTIRSSTPSTASSRTSKWCAQEVDDLANQYLGSRRACGNAKGAHAVEPVKLDLVGPSDEAGRNSLTLGHFDQPYRVRAVRGADHEQRVAAARNILHRRLPVGCSVANVLALRPRDLGESAAEGLK
jgi:hypothetical protein